jgi:hypothetical protein
MPARAPIRMPRADPSCSDALATPSPALHAQTPLTLLARGETRGLLSGDRSGPTIALARIAPLRGLNAKRGSACGFRSLDGINVRDGFSAIVARSEHALSLQAAAAGNGAQRGARRELRLSRQLPTSSSVPLPHGGLWCGAAARSTWAVMDNHVCKSLTNWMFGKLCQRESVSVWKTTPPHSPAPDRLEAFSRTASGSSGESH